MLKKIITASAVAAAAIGAGVATGNPAHAAAVPGATVSGTAASWTAASGTAASGKTVPASTADAAQIHVNNVSVTSMNTYSISGWVSGGDRSGNSIYDWTLKTSSNVADGSQSWVGGVVGVPGSMDWITQYSPGYSPLGTFHAYPVSDATDPSAENTATFYVKQGSHARTYATRSGSKVSVRACVQRYNDRLDYGTRGAWQNWASQTVLIQQQRSGKWYNLRWMTSGSNGCTPTYTFTYQATRNYKALVGQTSTIWNSISPWVAK